ncbi:hypothetical protein A2U01_0069984 [Trifolium medium]|uniref:Uncharacterized protein n=1 Tax=Trifolium medium TaxID=97028 RepID=A0A392SIP5_9FABA|nr:hypothetical protein [Trifolium medium]
MQFELMIQALELEETVVEGEHAGSEEEEDNSDADQEEDSDGGPDI